MKNLKQLCFFLSAGTIAALSISACSDDTPTTGGTAGTGTSGTGTAGTGTAGTGTAGTGTAGTGTAGTGTAGTGTAGTGTAGTATGGGGAGGSGGASGGSGGKGGAGGAGGSGGSGGTGGASGGSGGGGGSGGSAAPSCANDDDPANMMAATCDSYCTDFIATCGPAVDASPTKAFYTDKAACMTDCQSKFTTKQTGTVDANARLCCEAYHTRNAHTMGLDHCTHATGMGPCAGK